MKAPISQAKLEVNLKKQDSRESLPSMVSKDYERTPGSEETNSCNAGMMAPKILNRIAKWNDAKFGGGANTHDHDLKVTKFGSSKNVLKKMSDMKLKGNDEKEEQKDFVMNDDLSVEE